jgi:hypothetical protein
MIIGMVGTLAVRASQPDRITTRATATLLLALVALLGVTDEASTALIGLALGVTWLVDYRLIASERLTAFLVLVGLAVVFMGTNRLFAASLAPGSPVQSLTFSRVARVPSLFGDLPSLPLSTPEGQRVLFMDFLPMTACALAITLFAWRLRSRAYVAMAVFVWVLLLVAVALVLRLEINKDGSESQRFFIAPFFAGVVLSVVHWRRMPRGSLGSMFVGLGVVVPAFYSLYWIREQSAKDMDSFLDGRNHRNERLFDIDCRKAVGAHFRDKIGPAYSDIGDFLEILGCRPVYTFGDTLGSWPVRITPVLDPIAQLRGDDKNLVAKGADLDAICRHDGTPNDVVCTRALTHASSCHPEGRYLRCPLHPADRDALLGRAVR